MTIVNGRRGLLKFTKIHKITRKLKNCDTTAFSNSGDSFSNFTLRIKVNVFRHLRDVEIKFEHPITLISGTNKIGKTSLLLLLACSHENFKKLDSRVCGHLGFPNQ